MYCLLQCLSLRAFCQLQYCHFSGNWSNQGAYENRLLGPTQGGVASVVIERQVSFLDYFPTLKQSLSYIQLLLGTLPGHCDEGANGDCLP